jgi:hypothetical protein
MIFPNKEIFLFFREIVPLLIIKGWPIYSSGIYVYRICFILVKEFANIRHIPATAVSIFSHSLEEKESGFIKISGSSVVLYISEQKFHHKSWSKMNRRRNVAEFAHALPMHCTENFQK